MCTRVFISLSEQYDAPTSEEISVVTLQLLCGSGDGQIEDPGHLYIE